MLSYSIEQRVPYMTIDQYSLHTGLPVSTIKMYIGQGRIITKPKNAPKEKPLVNMVAMNELATREALALLG